MHELRRRFGINGHEDDVTGVFVGTRTGVRRPSGARGRTARRAPAGRRRRLRAVRRPGHAGRHRGLSDAAGGPDLSAAPLAHSAPRSHARLAALALSLAMSLPVRALVWGLLGRIRAARAPEAGPGGSVTLAGAGRQRRASMGPGHDLALRPLSPTASLTPVCRPAPDPDPRLTPPSSSSAAPRRAAPASAGRATPTGRWPRGVAGRRGSSGRAAPRGC